MISIEIQFGPINGNPMSVDKVLSTTSSNPVENRVITQELENIKADLHDVQDGLEDKEVVTYTTETELRTFIETTIDEGTDGEITAAAAKLYYVTETNKLYKFDGDKLHQISNDEYIIVAGNETERDTALQDYKSNGSHKLIWITTETTSLPLRTTTITKVYTFSVESSSTKLGSLEITTIQQVLSNRDGWMQRSWTQGTWGKWTVNEYSYNGHKHTLEDITDINDFRIEVDAELSETSENPVQNKVVVQEINNLKERQTALETRQTTLENEAEFLRGFHEEYQETKDLLNNCVTVCGYDSVPHFDEATTYLKNSLVFHDGRFWRFTTLHNPGAWNNSEVVETSLYTEIQNMRGVDVEQVLVHLSTYDNANIDWTALYINVTVEGEAIVSLPLDENGEVTFDVVKGKIYTIDYPSLDGYQLKAQSNHKAIVNVRTISHEYAKYTVAPEEVTQETITTVAHVYACNGTRYTTHQALVDAGLGAISPYGKEVTLSIDAVLDENGNEIAAPSVQVATFGEDLRVVFPTSIPYGTNYYISAPTIEGATLKTKSKAGYADYPAAYFYFQYTKISLDVRLFDAQTGEEYAIDDTLKQQPDEVKAQLKTNGVVRIESATLAAAVIDNDGNTGAGFYMKLPFVYESKRWAVENVEFDTKFLPFISNGETGDYKGQQNTRYIRAIGDGAEGGTGSANATINTPAADYCENPNHGESVARPDSGTATCCPALYIQGQLHAAYLPAISQIWQGIRANAASLSTIQDSLGIKSPVNFLSGSFWSSSQRNASNSWCLNIGSLNSYNKTQSCNALPIYDLHPIVSDSET